MSRIQSILADLRARHKAAAGDLPIGLIGCTVLKAEAPSPDDRTRKIIANTDGVDLDDEVVVPGGAITDYFFKNGRLFLEHFTDYESYVASLRSVSPIPSNRDIKAWRVSAHLRNTDLGSEILQAIDEDGIGASVGFIPVDWGKPTAEEILRYGNGRKFSSIVRTWKWLELSFTAFPCNVSCQSGKAIERGSKAGILADMVAKGRLKQATAADLGLVDSAPTRVHRIRCRV